MLGHPKALSTHHNYDSENLKDATMGDQQETKKITYFNNCLKINKHNKLLFKMFTPFLFMNS
jgi:hypothetical protein